MHIRETSFKSFRNILRQAWKNSGKSWENILPLV